MCDGEKEGQGTGQDRDVFKEDFGKSITHERPEPEDSAPTERPSDDNSGDD